MVKLKIIWYNLLRGFHKKESDGSFTFEPERLEAAKKIISSQNPDILFIGEGDFNPNCKIKGLKIQTIDYKKEFNYPYVYYSEPDKTSRKGECILSKIPFKAENLSRDPYGLNQFTDIKVNLSVDSKTLTFDIIHPYPTIPEERKAEEVKKVLDKKRTPYILLGDFNALSPEDKYLSENLSALFSQMQKDPKLVTKNVEESSKCLMVKEVINAGLIDTFKEKNQIQMHTLPTKKFSLFKNKEIGIRLDYIFCSKDFRVLESGIIQNKLTEIASDHYPIYALLEI